MTRPDAIQATAAGLDLVALEAIALPEATGLAFLGASARGPVEVLLLYPRRPNVVDPVEGVAGRAYVKVDRVALEHFLEVVHAVDPVDPEDLDASAVIRSALLLGKAIARSDSRRRVLEGALEGLRELEEEDLEEGRLEREGWGCVGCGTLYTYPLGGAVEGDEFCDACGDVLVPEADLEEERLEADAWETDNVVDLAAILASDPNPSGGAR